MHERIHVRLSGLAITDVTHPDYIDNLKKEIEKLLEDKGVLYRTWVQEIIIGKEVKKIE